MNDTAERIEFPVVDTTYWKTKDKQWMAGRHEQWAVIENYFVGPATKSKKAKGILKRYFLHGSMPDFKALKSWKSNERHLDLFCFLWLHPSWDSDVLVPLRDAYIHSPLVLEEDVSVGMELLFQYGALIASAEYFENEDVSDVIQTDGNNRLLFDLMIGNLSEQKGIEKKVNYPMHHIIEMSKWLCNKKLHIINNDCLYQYGSYLDFWYQSCPKNENYFDDAFYKGALPYIEKALYRIYYFDTEKEGDTCRTRFVVKIRKILDEREFIQDFKQLWLDVKAGKIQVENPWKR
ncbi:hypothetical protein [Thalassolituus sp. C2-1]|uniref:hypothetical protein n=1 Tax=Venatorbacter sp. C2-1 TaxID=2597518 RepID=UPI001191766F|nr:hypothetical protein [Thalassolituus sp. C2-1]TVV39397.1 hypothetical protein FOT50_19775 [Thalassolituus sp. C2-1]